MGKVDETIADGWCLGWRKRDSRPIYEAARESLYFVAPLTITGQPDLSISRHLMGPIDALQNHRIRQVNYMAEPRGGKTLDGDFWLWWLIRNSPGPFRWVFLDEKLAEDHETTRVKRILASDPVLRPHIPERGRLTNVLGMDIAIDGPALGNLQGRGYQYMIFDEVWRWVAGRIAEAKARMGDFEKLQNNKLFIISQGGVMFDDWYIEFMAGILHEWSVQCQDCGKYFQPVWSGYRPDGSRYGMVWDEKRDDRGFWDIPKAVPTARYVCLHCGGVHIDTPRLKSNWNLTGKYIAETTDKRESRVSFHSNALVSCSHYDLVELFLMAANKLKTGNPTAMIQFFQKPMAEFANEQTVFQGAKNFATARYEINSDWADEDARIMAIDSQQEGVFYVTVRAWSARARECRRLFRGKAQGESELVKIQEDFKVPSNWVLADSGYRAKGAGGMYAMCIRHGWIATKGVGTVRGNANVEGFWHTEIVGGRAVKVLRTYSEPTAGDPETGVPDRANLIKFASDQIADTLDGLISTGYWVEPPDDGSEEEKDYRFQMSSEFKKTRVDNFTKREITKRVCPSKRNHYYDDGKQEVLGAILLDLLPDPLDNRIAAERQAPPPEKLAA